MDADEDLYALIFGESIFNDAIAVVMYHTVKLLGEAKKEPGESNWNEIGKAIGNFFTIFIGSIFIGLATALIAAFV